ncbi:uncharacterized protein LACBIDRAFT_321428 [Laccaria bicolor S238N-H82]|uniref:3'-5' exonuclease n=1 Tax=Laccaria bicolor (strain S238N-H82 / ATCC MYA-4686) TaxID=486041 RepID=B0CQC2_LACBS|nr:uncharacterized protein LACBIDRAFT_321428 [Laccaria bicolor S238N-H82]EDR15529.1 predicted protein [Laccaria bicolor S238N-H82]|eukprot:XP_001873737.1 predicted protein [Laccaria bicolor S238N-H82]
MMEEPENTDTMNLQAPNQPVDDNYLICTTEIHRGPGRPRKQAVRSITQVQSVDGPVHMEPGINVHQPLAPIFLSQAVAAVPDQVPVSLPSDQNPISEPTYHEEVETFVLPAHDPLQQLDDSPGEDDLDNFLGLGNSNGINGDAASAEGDFTEDDGETSGQLPSLVLDAFWKKIEYLKGLTEGQGRSAKHLVYEKLQSFWLPHFDSFFYLRQKALSPEQLLIPRFFYWDPLLLVDRIPCPVIHTSGTSTIACSGILVRHGYCQMPCHIIDLENSYYLISCKPVHTFSSCNPLVIAKLPRPLAAQFPAYLSKRSGLSKQVFAIMRCCFQNSLGAKQFADSLNVLHHRFHDMLEVQYLQTVLERDSGLYKPFLSFESSPSAAPSGQYCQDIYDREIGAHEKEFDQHTAQLSSRGMGIDHSHKITKQIAKIQGEPVFTGLLTMTNEFGEIRICDLVPTKAHSQFDIALTRMNHSIKLFGLEPPRIIFTDNLADKPMLERHFPSLKEGVRPVNSLGDLPVLQLPSGCIPKVFQTATQINSAILSFIDTFSHLDGDKLVVGLDTEWDIAYGNEVWIFQLSEHIANGSFPAQLSTFLANSQILKVRRNVLLDLKNLQEDSESSTPFVGGIDLGRLAKEKNVVSDARASLGDLCIKTLSCILPKDLNIRISPDWSGPLTDEQIQYAALDAWASLKIYEKLTSLWIPVPVNFANALPAGDQIFVFHEDRTTIIACGIVSPAQFNSFEGINITKTQVLIQVEEIYVPGAKIHLHREQPLSLFGQTPFNMVCRRSQVKTFVPEFIPAQHGNTIPIPNASDSSSNVSDIDPLAELEMDSNFVFQTDNPDFQSLNINFCEANAVPATHQTANFSAEEVDRNAADAYVKILHDLTEVPWAPAIRSGNSFMIWSPKYFRSMDL